LDSRKNIYFISDVHLGAPALMNNKERELLFVSWLDMAARDAAEIFLMGDVFDFWFEYRKVIPRGFTRVLGKIAEITDSGIPVHFFTGNHDVWIFDYLPAEIGVTVHREAFVTELSGKRFFLAHGDGLDKDDKGYILLKKIFTNRILQKLYALIHPDMAIGIARYWSKHSRLAKKINGPEFRGKEEGLYRFARSVFEHEKADFFVFGHRHRVADLPIGDGSRFILLGEWIKTFSYGFFDGNNFEIKIFQT
jgi:UDP-2,3-diacylglucosamine hydrolase